MCFIVGREGVREVSSDEISKQQIPPVGGSVHHEFTVSLPNFKRIVNIWLGEKAC